jgi:serine/threonine-protein kinase
MTETIDRLRSALDAQYAVEELIGEGGMARVYRAADRKHGRTVAIKVLEPDLGASLGAERFLAEIRICASLSHPYILPLYDSGAAGDLLYFVMPFIEGESLRGRLERERQLPLDDALHIARGVAAALAYAHSRGIVHRDIKPENILLSAGEPIVADFGVAKAIVTSDRGFRTSAGVAIGTPAYMSPEQGSGASEIDGRSDLYSLACVLYEMLVGEPPFTGPTAMAITARKLTEAVPRVTLLRETVPPPVEQAILKALAKAPADRFATAWEFGQALSAAQLSMPGYGTGTTGMISAVKLPPPRSIAVLPFAGGGVAAGDEYFGDGLAEELIHLLGTVKGLHVVARTSAFAFKGTQEDVRSIGQKLNISTVLEGSVRRAGDRLRVTTQLVKVTDGYQLWSERYDRTADDVFAVQDEIARAVVDALKITLLGRPSGGGGSPRNMEAYELYLRGRHAWNLRTEEGLKASVSLLRRALELDDAYALVHAALADSYATLGIHSVEPADEVMPLAERAAEEALALEPALAEALATLGCVKAVYRWQWKDAEELFRQAIAAKPGYATAHHWLAINCLTPQRRFDEARDELNTALKTDPLNPSIRVSLGLVAHFAGDHGAAIEIFRRAIETDPGFGMARYFLGQTLEAMGRAGDALAAYKRAGELSGASPQITAALAHTLARMGQPDEAAPLLAELEAQAASRYISPALPAHVHIALGDHARALDLLERSCDERAALLIWLPVRPSFDPLRGEPRFRAILDRIGLGGR